MRRMDRQILWPDADLIGDLDNKILGALRITRAFLLLMPSDGTGRIINISGTASTIVWAPALTCVEQRRNESGDRVPLRISPARKSPSTPSCLVSSVPRGEACGPRTWPDSRT